MPVVRRFGRTPAWISESLSRTHTLNVVADRASSEPHQSSARTTYSMPDTQCSFIHCIGLTVLFGQYYKAGLYSVYLCGNASCRASGTDAAFPALWTLLLVGRDVQHPNTHICLCIRPQSYPLVQPATSQRCDRAATTLHGSTATVWLWRSPRRLAPAGHPTRPLGNKEMLWLKRML